MSWLSRVRSGIPFLPKRQTTDNLWHKCRKCESMVFTKEWEEILFVCPRCDHHDRIGPKERFEQVFDALGVDSLDSLEEACRSGRIAALKGFGAKTAEKILSGIAIVRAGVGLHKYSRAAARAEESLMVLRAMRLAERVEIAGEIRRRCEIVPGAIFLACVAALPTLLISQTSANFFFGGTSLLIVIGVALDTVKQLEAQLMMRNYEGFLK